MATDNQSDSGMEIMSPSGKIVAKAYSIRLAKKLCRILNDMYIAGERFDDIEPKNLQPDKT